MNALFSGARHERRPHTPRPCRVAAPVDDKAYWQQSPDAHYSELLRIADDLFGQGAIDLDQWQALKAKADQSHKDSPGVNVAHEVDDPEA